MSDLNIAARYLYHCPHCRSVGFLREKDGRCSFCSGRENGSCIECNEPCPGEVCEWCGKDQSLPKGESVNYSEADIEFIVRYGKRLTIEELWEQSINFFAGSGNIKGDADGKT